MKKMEDKMSAMPNEHTSGSAWPTFDDVSDLFAELDLDDEELEQAGLLIEDHVRAWQLAQARAGSDDAIPRS